MAGHNERQWQGKFFRCGMRCHYCYKPLLLSESTKEHLTPRSRGGSDTIDNIVPACWQCNQRKGDMTEEEFRQTFSKAFEILSSVPSPSLLASLESRDELPLAVIRKENEAVSWAWRHPA